MRERADVFVIGGGPAGLAAAIAARQKGLSVIVADGAEPPIDKACGEGLMPESLLALRDLGVQIPPGAGCPFRGIRLVQDNLQVAAELSSGVGIGLRRTTLHEIMIRRAETCSVKLLWKTPVVGIAHTDVQLPSGVVSAKWIIGADGANSRVRRWSNLNVPSRESRRMANRRHYKVRPWTDSVEIHWGLRAQAYVTPISSEDVCIVVMAATSEEADFEQALKAMPQLRQRLDAAQLCSRERGAVTAMHSLKRVWRENIALVGDASGSVDAITGEGLRLAFRQAFSLADALALGDLRLYARAHRSLSRRPFRMGDLMLQLGRATSIRPRVIRMLSRNPRLLSLVLAIHTGQANTGDVLRTGARLGWQFLAA